jgi:hypothetical protein
MTGGTAPRARGNGLSADSYTPLADLDPRLADALISTLAQAGIAAYVVPSLGQRGGYLDVHLPDRPTDRLWVDATSTDAARILLGQVPAAEPRQSVDEDEEAVWRALIAEFEAAPPPATRPWPQSEEVEDGTWRGGRGRVLRRVEGPLRPDPASPPRADSPAEAEEEEEHFVPPTPPNVPPPHPVTRWAWVALTSGIGILVAPALLGQTLDPALATLGLLGAVGGFVTLVARMRDDPPTDGGPDDGAVV